MATLAKTYKPRTLRNTLTRNVDALLDKYLPRRCMVVSIGLFLAGLSIPVLMFFQFMPVNFLVGAIGLALTATGGVLTLIYCGEI